MARNPKAVRRRYKAAHAEVRRGRYPYPPPTYDQLNRRKTAHIGYGLMCRGVDLSRAIAPVVQRIADRYKAAARTVLDMMRRPPERKDFRLAR